MAEGLKVRLVRCPKCDNLLPELPDYSVYKCGGCGTVLRAKKKANVTDELSEKSDEERIIEGSEKLDGIAGENGVSVVIVPETKMGSDGIDHAKKEQIVFKERAANSIASSSSRTQNREAFSDTDRNKGREAIDTRLEQTTVNKDIGHGNRRGRSSNRPIGNGVHRDGNGVNLDRSKLYDLRVEKEPGEIMHPNESLRLRETTYRRGMERDGREELYGNSKSVGEPGRNSAFVYPNEGHLNYHPGYINGYDHMKNHDYMDGPRRVENLEHDRAELHRKLDELKDQLSRSCDVADKPKEMFPVGRRMVPPDPYGSDDIYMSQPSAQGNTVSRPPYFNRSHGPVPSVNRHDIDTRNFYPPPRRAPIEIPGYEDPFQPQMLRIPQASASHYRSQSPYNDISGRYLDINQDPLAPFPHETCLYHPSCSCLHCNYRNWQVHPQGAYSVFGNRRFHEDSTLPNFYHDVDISPVNFGPRYNPKGVNTLQLHSQYPHPHKRSPSDLDSDFGGRSRYRPRRVVVSHGNRRLCHPLAGGAPFLTCPNCSKLLKVPRKIMLMEKNKRKLQCGACATIILLEAENKGLIVSNPIPKESIHAEIDDGSGELLNENWRDSHDFSSAGGKTSCPDVGNSPCNFQSTDTDANLLSNDQRLKMSDSENRQGFYYSTSIYSEEKESIDRVVHKDVSSLAELSSKDYISPPLLLSPIKDICSNHAASRFEIGNKSNRTNQEKVILNNSTSRHNTVNDVSVATEIDVSFNEYPRTGLSQDSVEVSKEKHLLKINKGSRSLFASLIKKSFRDFSRSSQGVANIRSTNVSVNGQPISYRVVQKAEKLAGPIQPGEYWYDFRAGFWGVMGQPCHGIIPPYIPEFDYPMPEKCGAGNTGVYVNGRELHQKDLDLLVSRGLPSTRNKYYILEISGNVMDEESGKELDNIGKLAPTSMMRIMAVLFDKHGACKTQTVRMLHHGPDIGYINSGGVAAH